MASRITKHRDGVVDHVLQRAVGRGEIDAAAITNELRDLLPGYLLYRSVVPTQPPTHQTVQALVDAALLPSLLRPLDKGAVR